MTNKKIGAIIVDDQKRAGESLKLLLERYVPEVEVLALSQTVADAMAAIENHAPELVFLDVELQGESGFDLFSHFEALQFNVIFTTGFKEYAIKAIRFSAVDYLLKPIDPTELKAAVSRLRIHHAPSDSLDTPLSKIALPASDCFHIVPLTGIIRCEAAANYCHFSLEDGRKLTVSRPLKTYAELLCKGDFLRVHQSHIVNLNHVRRFARGMARFVVMSDGAQIEVSRRHRAELLDRLSRFQP